MVGGLRSAAPEFTNTIDEPSDITGTAAWMRCSDAEEVHVEDLLPAVGVGVGHPHPVAGVVAVLHEVVEAAEALDGGRDHRPAVVGLRQVGRDDDGLAAQGTDLVGDGLEPLASAGGDDDVDALAGEPEGDGPAHARTGTGDDGDAAFLEHHGGQSSAGPCMAAEPMLSSSTAWRRGRAPSGKAPVGSGKP